MSKLPIVSDQPRAAKPRAAGSFAGNVALVTMGCAKNLVDSEVMLGVLVEQGFRPVDDPSAADLIVVNTCGFLQSAVEEGIERILELARFKSEGRCRTLVVAGCMVERYREKLAAELPEVDRFISVDEILSVADTTETTAACFDQARRPYFLYDETMPRLLSSAGHTAFVKIAEGCDRPCAFCIIPKLRGVFRSRSIRSVVQEVSELVRHGVKEINLVAQDLTAYGSDFASNRGVVSELPQLLQAIEQEIPRDGRCWVRLLYGYPVGVSDRLLELIDTSSHIVPYLDLPLQHISNRVLKEMRRPLGERGTRALIEKIRQRLPNLALRTTFLVGFPGETEEDLRTLERYVSEGHFTHLGVFAYSDEEEAASASLADQIPHEERDARRARIMEAQQAVVAKHLPKYLGRELPVLVEGFHQETDLLLVGRTAWQAPETDGEVIINALAEPLAERPLASLHGTWGTVRVEEVKGYDLIATLCAVA